MDGLREVPFDCKPYVSATRTVAGRKDGLTGKDTLLLCSDSVERRAGQVERGLVLARRASIFDGGGDSLAVVSVGDHDFTAAELGLLVEGSVEAVICSINDMLDGV